MTYVPRPEFEALRDLRADGRAPTHIAIRGVPGWKQWSIESGHFWGDWWVIERSERRRRLRDATEIYAAATWDEWSEVPQ